MTRPVTRRAIEGAATLALILACKGKPDADPVAEHADSARAVASPSAGGQPAPITPAAQPAQPRGTAAAGAFRQPAGAPAAQPGTTSPAAPGSPSPVDTARGIIAIVGADPATEVVLRPRAGGPDMVLSHPDQESLNRLSGLEVWVEGTKIGARHFVVLRFAVRGADGISALDGTLAQEGDRVVLVTADGRRLALAESPVALRHQIGARVWISGPLDRAPNSFGIITPAKI